MANSGEGKLTEKKLLELCPVAILALGAGGTIEYVNPVGCAILGYSSDELLGKPYRHFLPKREAAALRATLRDLGGKGPSSGRFTHPLHHSDGTRIMLETHFMAAHEEGTGSGAVLISIDVTHREEVREQVEILKNAIDQIDESVVITNREGVIEYVNRAFEETTGYAMEEALGKTPSILKSGKHEPSFYEELWKTVLSGRSYHGVLINRRKNGSYYYDEKTITPVRNEEGVILHHVATGTDVTHRKLNEEKLIQGVERFALSMEGTNDGLWDWDFRTGTIFFSKRWQEMLGFEQGEVGDRVSDWFSLVHPDDLPELKTQLRTHLKGATSTLEHEYRIRHKHGGFLWVLTRGLAVRDGDGKAYRMAGFQSDITDRKMAEEQLQHDALHDSLTGLPNRTLFLDRLNLSMARARRKAAQGFAIFFLDLDRFKIVNDGMGHLAGDHLLMETANRIQRCLRSSDTAARFGGDEFAVLLEGVMEKTECERFAHRILSEINRPFSISSQSVFTSGSMGITTFRAEYSKPEDMVRDADAAMYRAKNLGRNMSVFFTPDMHADALKMLQIKTDLGRAMEGGEFSVRYQPIVSLAHGAATGFECFLRWNHPAQGWIPPMEFIPIAVDNGLIVPIGRFVFTEAVQHLSRLRESFGASPPLFMSVNLSGSQFIQPDLIPMVADKLQEFGLPSGSLKLEITEGTISEHGERIEPLMTDLRNHGIPLSIDDFGTGFMSLRNLRRYPIDSVKIDPSFIAKMSKDEESLEIVKTTIAMARSLEIAVIAEGVETEEQAKMLRDLNCAYAQGFYFSKPLEADRTLNFLLGATS